MIKIREIIFFYLNIIYKNKNNILNIILYYITLNLVYKFIIININKNLIKILNIFFNNLLNIILIIFNNFIKLNIKFKLS